MDFWAVFAGVLGANLLTVSFVWGMVIYSRKEQQGTANDRDAWTPFIALMMPMIFCAMALMIATDSVPDWLNAAMK